MSTRSMNATQNKIDLMGLAYGALQVLSPLLVLLAEALHL